MNDLDNIEELVNESVDAITVQRLLVRSVLALTRRLDYVIAVKIAPHLNGAPPSTSKTAEPEAAQAAEDLPQS